MHYRLLKSKFNKNKHSFNLRKPVPEYLHSGFYWSKDDGGGGDNWSCKTRKALVKSTLPTYQHPAFLTGRMPFLSPNQKKLQN